MSSTVVRWFETEMRMAAPPRHTVLPSQARPSACTASIDRVREGVGVAAVRRREAHDDLVEHDLVEHLRALDRADALGGQRRQRAVALDQVDDALAPEAAQRGPDRRRRARGATTPAPGGWIAARAGR